MCRKRKKQKLLLNCYLTPNVVIQPFRSITVDINITCIWGARFATAPARSVDNPAKTTQNALLVLGTICVARWGQTTELTPISPNIDNSTLNFIFILLLHK